MQIREFTYPTKSSESWNSRIIQFWSLQLATHSKITHKKMSIILPTTRGLGPSKNPHWKQSINSQNVQVSNIDLFKICATSSLQFLVDWDKDIHVTLQLTESLVCVWVYSHIGNIIYIYIYIYVCVCVCDDITCISMWVLYFSISIHSSAQKAASSTRVCRVMIQPSVSSLQTPSWRTDKNWMKRLLDLHVSIHTMLTSIWQQYCRNIAHAMFFFWKHGCEQRPLKHVLAIQCTDYL